MPGMHLRVGLLVHNAVATCALFLTTKSIDYSNSLTWATASTYLVLSALSVCSSVWSVHATHSASRGGKYDTNVPVVAPT